LKVYSDDEDAYYISYCTPECSALIDFYLEYRRLHGERPVEDDAPLIRELFDIDDEIRAAKPKRIDTQAFRKMIRIIGLKAGVIERQPVLDGRGERRAVKCTHGLRKAFQTTAINAGMSPLYSEILMGHTSGGLALESYVKPTDEDLLEGNDRMRGYIGIIDQLTISDEHRLKEKVEKLQIEVSKVDGILADLAQMRQQLGLE
jgi:hypothetical protein